MPPSDPVLWFGPPAPWAAALGPAVHVAGAPAEVAAASRSTASLVVLGAEHVEALSGWLHRPQTRPPVVVLTDDPADEVAALRAGAEETLPLDAGAEAAARTLDRARVRHDARGDGGGLFQLMVESATDLIVVLDAAGRCVYASPALFDVIGRVPEEVVGAWAFDYVHPDDAEAVAALYVRRIQGTEAARPVRFRAVGTDRKVRVLEGLNRTVTGPDGGTYGIVCVRDVTEEEETTLRLRASEARYRTVVAALPDVVSRIRLDGLVLDFHVPAVFETEFPAEAMIGHRLQDIIPDDLAEKFLRAVDEMRATGEGVSYDYVVRVGGVDKHREVRLAPLGDDEMISMIRDVTALREQEAALMRSRAELRALAAHLQGVREEERTRLSREVHDVLGQALTAVRLGVGWFGRRFPDDEAVQDRLSDTRAIIDETLGHVRQIAADLRPGVLDDFGLRSAVEWEAARFEERTGLTCVVEVDDRGAEPPPDVATAAFRVLQEALTNVARHAEAEVVEVALSLAPEAVHLVVVDDGRGLAPEAAGRRTLGLLGMRERARAVGGSVEVRGELGRGAVVDARFPLSPSAA